MPDLIAAEGLAPDPYQAYLASGYGGQVITERVGGDAAGWGA